LGKRIASIARAKEALEIEKLIDRVLSYGRFGGFLSSLGLRRAGVGAAQDPGDLDHEAALVGRKLGSSFRVCGVLEILLYPEIEPLLEIEGITLRKLVFFVEEF
jgi:hypothetical protein